jgi:uncharacterized RDD family membrane protein YckC
MKQYDTFGQRFFALCIDGIILKILVFFIKQIPEAPNTIPYLICTVLALNTPYVYSVILQGQFGQTIGKMITKIKVVDFKTENNIGYYQALIRDIVPILLVNLFIILSIILYSGVDIRNYQLTPIGLLLVKLPSYMLIIWSVTEIITMMFNNKNRALHDFVADTVVIRIDKRYF